MRWVEVVLFLAPFLLYAAWRVAAAKARPELVWWALGAVGAAVVATVWLGLAHRLDRGQTYVPAHLENGQIVPGHGVRLSKP